MGTNYYLLNPPPKYLQEGERDLHIGKSSAGWAFSLHVSPCVGLNGWEEWEKILSRKKSKIINEYNEVVTFAELKDLILHRAPREPLTDRSFGTKSVYSYFSISTLPQFLQKNHAWQDSNGLLRHEVDGRHCIWNSPDYTFDAILGVFC